MIHHFLTENEIAHLTQLHVVDKVDDVEWRNSDDCKKWKAKIAKQKRLNHVH